jgi:multidrug efflux pump subunit AcrA (membrane-fusion protein)
MPAGAVSERGQLQSVFVADNGVARTRLITVGDRTKNQLEVLSGLSAGDKIIFPAPKDLSDGSRIKDRL